MKENEERREISEERKEEVRIKRKASTMRLINKREADHWAKHITAYR